MVDKLLHVVILHDSKCILAFSQCTVIENVQFMVHLDLDIWNNYYYCKIENIVVFRNMQFCTAVLLGYKRDTVVQLSNAAGQ